METKVLKETQEEIKRKDNMDKSLESAIRDLDRLYNKARRFLTNEDAIELTKRVDKLRRYLRDLIW